jgi:hypothetical protein
MTRIQTQEEDVFLLTQYLKADGQPSVFFYGKSPKNNSVQYASTSSPETSTNANAFNSESDIRTG